MSEIISSISSLIEKILFQLLSGETKYLSNALNFFGKPGKIAVVAYGLGMLFIFGLYLVLYSRLFLSEGALFMLLSIFHMWEFIFMSKFHESECTEDSFLVNHSFAFVLATILSQLEYFLELIFFGKKFKSNVFLVIIGTLLCVFGQFIRTGSMIQAGNNFHHYIQEKQSSTHQLVTSGFYAYFRHPSYFGWFIWAISTQIVLSNPIMFIIYSIVTWKFFNSRILYEEMTLIEQYGDEYISFQKKVPIRIIGIKGFIYNKEKKD